MSSNYNYTKNYKSRNHYNTGSTSSTSSIGSTNSTSSIGSISSIGSTSSTSSTRSNDSWRQPKQKTEQNGFAKSFTYQKNEYPKKSFHRDGTQSNSTRNEKIRSEYGTNSSNTDKNSTDKFVPSIPNDEQSIKNWVEYLDNTESEERVEELSIYAQTKIDNRYWDNVDLIKEMIRNHKFRVLDGVLAKIDTSKLEQRKYKPHNENVWVGKQIPETITSDLIIETFKVLIKYFSFTDLSENSIDGSNKLEVEDMLRVPKAFFTSIIKRDRRLPTEIQNEIYQYYFNTLGCRTPDAFASAVNLNQDIMKNTREIISRYFNSDKPIKKRLETAESFLGAILNRDNKILPSVRDICYQYFTHDYIDVEHFTSCLRAIINKITESNWLLFKDIMLFILSRDVHTITRKFFNFMVFREFTGINEQIAFMTMLSNPSEKVDFSRYFGTIDIRSFQHEFVSLILSNYNDWVNEIIMVQKLKNPDVDESEFKSIDLAVVMMMMGISYSNGYKQTEIISHMISLSHGETNIIKGFGVFVETSKIDLKNLNEDEKNLICKFFETNYIGKSIQNKMTIESMFEKLLSIESKVDLRPENIQLFLDTGSFLTVQSSSFKAPTKIIKKSFSQSNAKSNVILSSRFGSLDDDDSDDSDDSDDTYEKEDMEENNDLEEAPEPNQKIIRILESFRKFKDYDIEQAFVEAIDEVVYSIQKDKFSMEEFAYSFIHNLSEAKISDIPQQKRLIQELNSSISGYQNISEKISELIVKYPELIDNFICDNPNFKEIISNF